MSVTNLTQARLKELLSYDPDTGVFTWRRRACSDSVFRWENSLNLRLDGVIAGCLTDRGYCEIGIDGVRYAAHRLAWLYVYGKMPTDQLDHINGARSDNRIANLRETTNAINRQNIRTAYRKKSNLPLGVYLNKNGGPRPYIASVANGSKSKHVGCFSTPEEAHEAYLKRKRELHVGCTI